MISNAVFLANCANNPYLKPNGSKKNIRLFERYQKQLVRKINKGNFEVSVWDKMKLNKGSRKI